MKYLKKIDDTVIRFLIGDWIPPSFRDSKKYRSTTTTTPSSRFNLTTSTSQLNAAISSSRFNLTTPTSQFNLTTPTSQFNSKNKAYQALTVPYIFLNIIIILIIIAIIFIFWKFFLKKKQSTTNTSTPAAIDQVIEFPTRKMTKSETCIFNIQKSRPQTTNQITKSNTVCLFTHPSMKISDTSEFLSAKSWNSISGKPV